MNLAVGQQATRTLEVTPETVRLYADVTGDRNPLHFDEAWTARTRFKRLMAQGGIATGLLHALVAMDMPGPGTVFMKQQLTFPLPVYIGDTITATATVISVRASRNIAEVDFVVKNQDGDDVLTGSATIFQAHLDSPPT